MIKNNGFWLCLWWWAARWFAHVWVYKYLEENNINIIEVSWTSMWALIWAWIAVWYTYDEIEKICDSINYFSLIDFDLNCGFLKWNNIYKKLKEIFRDKHFNNIQKKLKIISTNFETWEVHLFKKWKIADAVMASISVPWFIRPFTLNSKEYVDWWLVSNLPIEYLEQENIIAVSVLKDTWREIKKHRDIFWFQFWRNFFEINYQVIQKTLDIMMSINEKKSLNSSKNILYIKPKFTDIDYYEFYKHKEIIQIWYNFIKENLDVKSFFSKYR